MKRPRILVVSGWACRAEELEQLRLILNEEGNAEIVSVLDLGDREEDVSGGEDASAYALSLVTLVSKLGAPLVLVGWSMGGIVALEAVARLGLDVNGLVLVGATAKFCRAAGYPCGVPRRNLKAFGAGLVTARNLTLKTFFRDASSPIALAEDRLLTRVDGATAFGTGVLKLGLDYLGETDLRENLSSVSIPMLAVHGREDKVIPWEAAAFLSSRVLDCSLVVRENVGHAVLADRPDLVVRDITDFARGVI